MSKKHKNDSESREPMSRREALKSTGIVGAAAISSVAVVPAQAAGETPTSVEAKNPYGGKAGGGISLPPYYKPTPYVTSRSTYFPGAEKVGKNEMRISFVGSCPFPPRRSLAGTCIMVELGNGDRFFFDFGPGCLRNICAMQVPIQLVNDIFLSHLHVDHYHDISYLLPFSAWAGSMLIEPKSFTRTATRRP